MTHENHPHHTHPTRPGHDHPKDAKKKAPTKCGNCGIAINECKCQTGCCGGACPNCNF